MKTWHAPLLCWSLMNAACSSQNCDDIACVSRVELSAEFDSDGEWHVDFGPHGFCDVTVSANRATSTSCSGAVTLSGSPDADIFLIDATPKTLTITYSGVEDGTIAITPQYEDQKAGCSKPCLVGAPSVRIGAD